jgi:Skp family chaperone for outer membrane proteins
MMMKRWMLFVLLLIPAAAAAQAAQAPAATPKVPPPPATPGSKFAVLNFRDAMTDSDPGLAAQKEYEKGMAKEKERLEALNKEIMDLQEKLKTAKTDAEKSTLSRQIDDKGRDMTRAQEDAQKLSQDLQDKLLPPIAQMVNDAVRIYAERENLAVVLDPTIEGNNIVFANKASDITADIMRAVNAEYAKNPKAATAPAATATPAKTP